MENPLPPGVVTVTTSDWRAPAARPLCVDFSTAFLIVEVNNCKGRIIVGNILKGGFALVGHVGCGIVRFITWLITSCNYTIVPGKANSRYHGYTDRVKSHWP